MQLGPNLISNATRSFSLAVDVKFNKGRKREYVIASCLYLQSRMLKEPYMLIDFSESLQVGLPYAH